MDASTVEANGTLPKTALWQKELERKAETEKDVEFGDGGRPKKEREKDSSATRAMARAAERRAEAEARAIGTQEQKPWTSENTTSTSPSSRGTLFVKDKIQSNAESCVLNFNDKASILNLRRSVVRVPWLRISG